MSPFLDTVKSRRTYYALNKDLTISNDAITKIVQEAIQAVPSPFNSQSNRAVVLFGAEHDKLWDIVTQALKSRVAEDQWKSTEENTAGFKAAGGTILFFVDETVVNEYATKFASYADKFPVWGTHSDGMLQFALWTALEAEGLGANLQHYNPIIDTQVAEQWKIPTSWQLSAQLVFGGRVAEPSEKTSKPLDEKLKVFGA